MRESGIITGGFMFYYSSRLIIICESISTNYQEFSSKESGVRNKAALRLASYGKEAKPAVPALIRLLSDENPGVRSFAAYDLR